MNDLVATLGFTNLLKSRVSDLAKELDVMVDAFPNRMLGTGSYFFHR